ncbi:MAG: hypothetical protein ACREJ4_15525 [Candidatus Methylomirabilaceae bacterium]
MLLRAWASVSEIPARVPGRFSRTTVAARSSLTRYLEEQVRRAAAADGLLVEAGR